jgi:hypothetical protein
MIRIVGVQRSDEVAQEFILLQNQGNMKVNLRGHALVADLELLGLDGAGALHLFSDDVEVQAGAYVLLRTVPCRTHWNHCNEGQLIYHTTMSRTELVWSRCEGALHLLKPQHTYCERNTVSAVV